MSLEAQEVAVRVRLLGGTAFQTEADAAAASVRNIGKAAEEANVANGTGGLSGFLGGAGKNLDAMNGKLDTLSKKSLQVGRETAVVSAGASFLIYESVKEAAAAEGKFRLLESQAHATLKMRKELEAGGKGMARFGIDPTEYADALYPIQSVFHNVTTDIEAVKVASMGAAIGHDSLLNATNAMVGGFRSGFKDIHSFSEEMALLDETVGAGKMHLPELTSAFKGSLFPTAASLKIPQRDVLGLLAAASQTGQDPQEYATRFRTTLLKMGGLKGEALKAATNLGFTKNQMAEEYKKSGGIALILRQLEQGRKKVGEVEGNNDISKIFGGSRSAGTIFTALQLTSTYEEIVKRLDRVSASKTLDTHFKQTTGTMTFQLKVLKSEFKETLNEMGKFFGPPVLKGLKEVAKFVQEAAHSFGELPTPVKDAAGLFVVFLAALAPAAFIFSGMAAGLRLLFMPLKSILGAYGSLGAVVEGSATKMAPAGKVAFASLGKSFAVALVAGYVGGLVLSKSEIVNKLFNLLTGGLTKHRSLKEMQNFVETGTPHSTAELRAKGGSGYAFGLHPEANAPGPHRVTPSELKSLFHIAAGSPAPFSTTSGAFPSTPPTYYDYNGTQYSLRPGQKEQIPGGPKIELTIHHQLIVDGKVLSDAVDKVKREHLNRR